MTVEQVRSTFRERIAGGYDARRRTARRVDAVRKWLDRRAPTAGANGRPARARRTARPASRP